MAQPVPHTVTYFLSAFSLDTPLVFFISVSFKYSLRPISRSLTHTNCTLSPRCVFLQALCRRCIHSFSLEWQGDIACHISIPWQSPFLLRVIISFRVKGSICYKRARAAGTERGVEDEPYLGCLVYSGQVVLIGELRESRGRAAALADVRRTAGQ